MANEFRHNTTNTTGRTEAQYHAISEHIFNNQAIGDVPIATATGQLSRLAVGTTAGWVLSVGTTGLPVWAANSAVVSTSSIWDAKGDLAVGTGANAGAVLTVGANHTRLTAASGETTGQKWAADYASISYIISGGTSAITTGIKGYLEVPFACNVTAWTLLGNVTGELVVDVWKDTYANYPPTDADAMPGAGHEPTITGANKGQDTNASDWATVAIAAGSILGFNVDSCSTISLATLSLKVQKTY